MIPAQALNPDPFVTCSEILQFLDAADTWITSEFIDKMRDRLRGIVRYLVIQHRVDGIICLHVRVKLEHVWHRNDYTITGPYILGDKFGGTARIRSIQPEAFAI